SGVPPPPDSRSHLPALNQARIPASRPRVRSAYPGYPTSRSLASTSPQAIKGPALRRGGSWKGRFCLHTPRGPRVTEWRVTPHKDPGAGLLYVEDQTEQHAREQEHRQRLDRSEEHTSELQSREKL